MFHIIAAICRLFATTWPSAVVALAAWISIVACIDPAGSYPNMPEGPGLTVDEIFNVEQGVLLVEQARPLGWLLLIPGTSLEAFKPENHYLPDHPPLGRYWLGVHHHLTWWLAPPFEPEGPFVTACARTGSATAFALTVWLIGAFVAFLSGGPESPGSASVGGPSDVVRRELPGDSRPPLRSVEGLLASLALVLMPRVYGHAHLASLETITNLTCTAAVLAVAAWWNGAEPPSRRVALLTGVVMGLALLTKIQAVLIPVPVIAWALWRWRTKAIVPLLVWGVTANVVFFALWPYLWLDPIGHFLEYLGRTTNRATIHCYYFGVRYDDKAVPWHYPFVMFAITVPVGLHVLGAWGLFRTFGRRRLGFFLSGGCESARSSSRENRPAAVGDSPAKEPLTLALSPDHRSGGARRGEGTRQHDILLLACTVFPLIVFALPEVAVYDGERLFLTVFPLWAIFVGRGLSCLWSFPLQAAVILRCLLICALMWLLAISIHLRPCQLCYYNELVGGLSGADRLGMEVDYWGVGVSRGLLQAVASGLRHGDKLAIGPTLHQFQAEEYRRQSPILRQQQIKVVAVETVTDSRVEALLFRRRADLSPDRARESPKVRLPDRWWGRDFVGPFIETLANNSTDQR